MTKKAADNLRKLRALHGQVSREYGLEYKLRINTRAKRRLGCCKHRDRVIELSDWILPNFDEARDTLLHELAHAAAGPGHGHDAVWRGWCRKLGARPERCANVSDIDCKPRALYEGTCPECGNVAERHRKSRVMYGGYRCGACKKGTRKWVNTRTGQAVAKVAAPELTKLFGF